MKMKIEKEIILKTWYLRVQHISNDETFQEIVLFCQRII